MQGDDIANDIDLMLKKLTEVKTKPDKPNKRDLYRVQDALCQLRSLFHYLVRPPSAPRAPSLGEKLWSCVHHVRPGGGGGLGCSHRGWVCVLSMAGAAPLH